MTSIVIGAITGNIATFIMGARDGILMTIVWASSELSSEASSQGPS